MFSRAVHAFAGANRRQGRRAAKRYLRQVKKLLPCSRRLKRPFLSQLKQELFLFCAEAENAGWNDLLTRFGTPENAADEFLLSIEPHRQRCFLRSQHRATVAVCALFTLVTVFSLLYALNCNRILNDEEFIESVTQVVDTPPEVAGPTYDHFVFFSEDNPGEIAD